MRESALPPPETLRGALDRLEAFATHAGTLALHDPLYFLLAEPDPAHLTALGVALQQHPEHPLAPRLRADFAAWLEVEDAPPSLEGILRAEGPWDPEVRPPLAEVRWRLQRAREVRQVLEARIQTLEQAATIAARTANGMAAAAAMVSVVALLGWLAALGVWEIPWLEPLPTLEELRQPPTTTPGRAPAPAPGEGGAR